MASSFLSLWRAGFDSGTEMLTTDGGRNKGTHRAAAGIAGHPWSLEELFDAIQ